MTAPQPSRRARILAYLTEHPGQTAYEICVGLGYRRRDGSAAHMSVMKLLRDMERKAQVVATTEWRPQQGRPVHLWQVAPLGTLPRPPQPLSPAQAQRRRQRDRVQKRRSRARRRGPLAPAAWRLPGVPACRDSDPDLFFPGPGESADPAKAICAACRVRAECLALARANGERFGIWGGVDLEAEAGLRRPA
jgi:WhiB family redox-sensing transcriptional regulator